MVVEPLDAMDQRILGALLEKQRTVPASYPLTLNSLRTACNQTTSRDPVTDYDDRQLEERLRDLNGRALVRVVWAGKGSRTLKHHQLLEESLGLDAPAVALLTVLLLRGPQSAGELKTRTERLHPFADRDAVEVELDKLAGGERPLVARLERRAGQHDARWMHLLGPQPAADSVPDAAGTPAVDRETVLADGPRARDERTVASWDAVAASYAESSVDELDRVPLEGWLIDRVPGLASGLPVVDLGCGPGHVAGRLADDVADIVGMDPSPAMLDVAREWNPGVTFEPGGLDRLLRPRTAAAWGVVIAWYSLIHLAPSELPDAFAAMARTVAPGGYVLTAFHVGNGVRHADEWLGEAVDLDVVLHDPAAIRAAASSAGLEVAECYVRTATADESFDRCYLLGRRAS